jgi:hypothetical protein
MIEAIKERVFIDYCGTFSEASFVGENCNL